MKHGFLKTVLMYCPDGGDGGSGGAGGSEGGAGNPPAGGENNSGTPGNSGNPPGEGSHSGAGGQHDVDESGWDDKTRNYIKSLRTENAKYRTGKNEVDSQFKTLTDRFSVLESGLKKALGIDEGANVSPEDQVKALSQVNETQEFRLAVRDIAIESGLMGRDSCNYLEYLIGQEADNLKDNEEISDERMDELIAQVKKTHGGSSNTGSTSITGKGNEGHRPTPGEGNTDVTLEEFSMMGTTKKGELFGKNPTLYNKLVQQAKEKGLLVT